MSSHFLFHSEASETVPFNARYAYPSQASRVTKSVVKIPPRTGTTMSNLGPSSKGRTIQITLPAQGYLNPLESYLRFDLSFSYIGGTAPNNVDALRTLNSIHGMFRRLRVSYGSLVLEDIQNYGTLVRMITNVAVENDYSKNSGAILESMGSDAVRASMWNPITTNAGVGPQYGTYATGLPIPSIKRSFCLNLASGLLTQGKLLPLKWMANQFTIELELDEPAAFLVHGSVDTAGSSLVVSDQVVPQGYKDQGTVANDLDKVVYNLDNIYFVGELLEFDSTYDAAFYQGMLQGGVPIKFASWHGHQHVVGVTQSGTYTIQERSRSIKSAFSVIRSRNDITPSTLTTDPNWFYPGGLTAGTEIDEFQWRIGGRYFPSQPVKCTSGAEPLIELQKALNVLGDYSIGTGVHLSNWFVPKGTFVIATEFESTNGTELSGINAEELADLALSIKLTGNSDASQYINTFIYYDSMLIIRPNNVVELVQ